MGDRAVSVFGAVRSHLDLLPDVVRRVVASRYEGVEDGAFVASMAGGYEEWDFEPETGAPADD